MIPWSMVMSAAEPPTVSPARSALEVCIGSNLQRTVAASSPLRYDSYRNVGFGGSFSLAIRSRYPLLPTLELARFGMLEASRRGSVGIVDTTVYAWVYRAGIAADLWRIRPAAGIALYSIHTSARTLTNSYASHENSFGYFAALSAYPLIRGPVRLALEVRADFPIEAAMSSYGAGVRVSYDALSF